MVYYNCFPGRDGLGLLDDLLSTFNCSLHPFELRASVDPLEGQRSSVLSDGLLYLDVPWWGHENRKFDI